MASFVLEVGTEELPSLFLPNAEEELKNCFFNVLKELGYNFFEVLSYSTPRRLVVYIPEVNTIQPISEECVIGPPIHIAFDNNGKPTKVAEKFSATLGLHVDKLIRIENKKGEYLAGMKKKGGKATSSLLGGVCESILRSLHLPKRMYWEGSNGETFLRPVRWILSLFDQDIIPINFCGVHSSNKTFGHRIHGPGPFNVSCSEDFFIVLEESGKITLDRAKRRHFIIEKGNQLAETLLGSVIWKDKLLEEVEGLVEHPYPLLGAIDSMYLELPPEVLLTSMEVHQKTFGIKSFQGTRLMPNFLTVLNMEPSQHELVRQGWERVLHARLSDAYFFWKADLGQTFETWCNKLEKVTFLAPLGTMMQKTQRLSGLCIWLAHKVSNVDVDEAKEVGLLSKADLVSEVVKEFDTLQGIMGGIYAKKQGKKVSVAQALAEQYLPSGPDTNLPQTDLGSILSIADKIDTLVGCFGLNMIPTGTSDPYALRRYALGIIRILLEREYLVSIDELITEAQKNYKHVSWKLDPIHAREELKKFFVVRLKNYFSMLGYESRSIDAVMAVQYVQSDYVHYIKQRLEVIKLLSKSRRFETIILSFKRVVNILNKYSKEVPSGSAYSWNKEILVEDIEKKLSDYLSLSENILFESIVEGVTHKAIENIKLLSELVDSFFENVMVMCDNEELKKNRLQLLRGVEKILLQIGDFSALQM